MSADETSRQPFEPNDDELQLAADSDAADRSDAVPADSAPVSRPESDGAPEIAVPASLADGTILQADAQYGMKLVRETTGDVYGIQTEAEENAEIAQSLRRPQENSSDAELVAPPVDAADVYGLAEPIPTSPQRIATPRSNAETAKTAAPKSNGSAKKRAAASQTVVSSAPLAAADDRETTSLEEIYERKRRERLEQGDELFQRAERAELPERPFWDRIFHPFASIAFLIRVGLISAAAFVPLFLATHFFSRFLANDVANMLENHQETSVLIAFFSCVWRDKVIFMLFCFLWGVFSIPHSFHIFVETANGADEIDEWPEYNFIGGLGQFLWLATLVAIAGVPGAGVFSALGLNTLVGFTLSATTLAPIFFLSCMQTDSLFTLATKEILRSLKNLKSSWLNFFFIAFSFLFGTIGLALAAIGFVVRAQGSFANSACAAAIVSLAFSFVPALYLRFLGRLAWIIDDDTRRRAAKEDESESDDDSSVVEEIETDARR